ncbi:class I SAM-dependent methyltransferase [Actinomycetospora termitidis]|uniref:Class I SAM-dependent methyltransferase n=1 Tax=Actinomycetospora termitidis TaxID=3053470 RepID=A0ABT7MC81_9PSEU|nr:class I SAM-dependent methyltransferase [Actinomycetospora sp. Odt1-22]MDL5158066.1 class I SAM-dependent methyltransferase [Actinomycetospora sp. Odt1-22]
MTEADHRPVSLTGVPETALWTLFNRATEPTFADPWAERLCEVLEYPYRQRFGSPSQMHPLRARAFDAETVDFLDLHPDAVVVALGEGLQTSYWRIGREVPWVSVDLPEVQELRAALLPADTRAVTGSALDPGWMDAVPVDRPAIVTAEGLLMYFSEADALGLIAACAARFPGGRMLFDTIPPWFSRRTLEGLAITEHYTAPPMPWGISVPAMRRLRVPGVAAVRELPWPSGRGLFRRPWPQVAMALPWVGGQRPASWALDFCS